ncbi:MAG: (d)CMP kinase [Candidatus Krumholzibacteria bacterium]|nr:(d)CMP kinase [Candidatus Krumholzibacteria bacterium]
MTLTERAAAALSRFIVTIDGPAGSGKSTTASILASRLGLAYLDTGAMYRAVAHAVIERGIDPEDAAGVSDLASGLELEMRTTGEGTALFLDGKNVEGEIRTPEVSRLVSPVSRHEGVRRAMVRLQRLSGARGGIVAEGRDTGSVVFPYAEVKVFLVADIEARTRRRLRQLKGAGIEQDAAAIKANILERDAMDSGRELSPLLRPAGAFTVDTSGLTIEAQVALIEAEVLRQAERISGIAVARGESNPFDRTTGYFPISQRIVRALFRALFGLRISGREHLRYRENYIFASNHLSYGDPLVVGCALDREVWFLAKKELFRNRLFAWLIRAYHAIPVDREEIERKTMKHLFDLLGAGRSILMFPEGTRSRTGELRDLKAGLGFIASKSGMSIVPVYVTGTNRLFDCFLRREELSVRIGPPIRLERDRPGGNGKEEYRILAGMAQSEIRMLMDESEV